MISLDLLVNILEVIWKWMKPSTTRLGSFRKFLKKKIKEAKKLSKKRDLDAEEILHWYQRLSRGLIVALGSDVKNRDVDLNWAIIKSRVDGLKFYGDSSTRDNLERTLNECNSFIELMRKEISPDSLSQNFEPADLREC